MKTNLRTWLPITVCCVPGVVAVAVVGIGIVMRGAIFNNAIGGPLGLMVVALAMLACPISMGLMMLRQHGSTPDSIPTGSPVAASCCPPGEILAAEGLAELREKREALERELSEPQVL